MVQIDGGTSLTAFAILSDFASSFFALSNLGVNICERLFVFIASHSLCWQILQVIPYVHVVHALLQTIMPPVPGIVRRVLLEHELRAN